jgi:hypothetical protein
MVKDQMGLASASQPAASEAEPAVMADDKAQADQTTEEPANPKNPERTNPTLPETGTAKFYPTSSILRELRASQRGPMHKSSASVNQAELLREHLYGTLPASNELEQYEVTERPMYLRG